MSQSSLHGNSSPGKAIHLSVHTATGKRYAHFVRTHLLAAHAIIKSSVRELSIAFVGKQRMSQLHQQFMGVAGPTDVLTFPLETDARERVTAGEIVVCIPQAIRQAKLNRTEPRNEILLYAVHGLLHLSGWDDKNEPDFKKMHCMEDKILTRLGVGKVFKPDAPDIKSRGRGFGGAKQ